MYFHKILKTQRLIIEHKFIEIKHIKHKFEIKHKFI